jgi:NTP pyrophosphatase (non-canonical NTP hydrolase)
MHIREFQELIEETYFERDSARGRDRTFLWFVEEVGELARALARPRDRTGKNLREEFADVLAWLSTLASIEGISLEDVACDKYGKGCPKCGTKPCGCP